MLAHPVRWTLGLAALGTAAACYPACYSGGPLERPTIGEVVPSARRLRRLSSREYDNVVRDLLGDASHPARAFVLDAFQNGYDNGSAGLAVQSDQVVDYQTAAEVLAAAVAKNDMARLIGGCDLLTQGEPACVEAFLTTVAARAFRRPLTTTERERLRDVYETEAVATGFERGVQTMLEVVLQSPEFLYREELGALDAVAKAGATVRMTDYELASELSFLLTGSIPDDELWAAAESGRLATTEDLRREATRLLQTNGAKDTLRAFLHEWLGTDRLPTLTKESAFYPTFGTAMAAAMSTELDRFYDDALFADSGSLRQLFTSNQASVDDTLAKLYGLPPVGPTFQPVTLDAKLRKGVLSRAGFLAVHASTDSSGPIARGVFVLQTIMCSPPPQPPANVPPVVPATDPLARGLTTRERFDRHASEALCASCHNRIDGVGFGFEQFDGIGAYRTRENGKPVDSSGTVIDTGEIDGAYDGVGGLAIKLAGSRVLAHCFVTQAYRYAMGQIERRASDLQTLDASFSNDAKLTDVLLAIVTSPAFVNRTFESPLP